MKNKRSKLQIYFDVISAIMTEKQDNGEVSKTRLQHKSNTSYDKLLKFLNSTKLIMWFCWMVLLLSVGNVHLKFQFLIKDLALIWNLWIISLLMENIASVEKMIGSCFLSDLLIIF